MDIKSIRLQTGLTQREFASKFQIPLKTLQHWECGDAMPAPYLLQLIAQNIPQERNDMKKISSQNTNYYYDSNEHAVYSEDGTKIILRPGILEKANERNLSIYLDFLFEDFKKSQEHFEYECQSDQNSDIEWERFL